MSYIGCYTLMLYCDHPDSKHSVTSYDPCPPQEFIGHTFMQCKREARRAGWRFLRILAPEGAPISGPRTICPRHPRP